MRDISKITGDHIIEPINIYKYLTEEYMRKIAEEIYREKVSIEIDRLMGDRNLI